MTVFSISNHIQPNQGAYWQRPADQSCWWKLVIGNGLCPLWGTLSFRKKSKVQQTHGPKYSNWKVHGVPSLHIGLYWPFTNLPFWCICAIYFDLKVIHDTSLFKTLHRIYQLQVGLTNPPNTLNFRFAGWSTKLPLPLLLSLTRVSPYHLEKPPNTSLDLPAPNQKQPKNRPPKNGRIFQPTDDPSASPAPLFLCLKVKDAVSWCFFRFPGAGETITEKKDGMVRNSPNWEGSDRQILTRKTMGCWNENFQLKIGFFCKKKSMTGWFHSFFWALLRLSTPMNCTINVALKMQL